MQAYRVYFWYIIVHKWHVMWECFRVGLYWQGLTHDLSKFKRDEFIAYAKFFYGTRMERIAYKLQFDLALLKHYHRNKHHWQWWIINKVMNQALPVKMPKKYAMEMMCDWAAMSTVRGEFVYDWWVVNGPNMVLHSETRKFIAGHMQIRKDRAIVLSQEARMVKS